MLAVLGVFALLVAATSAKSEVINDLADQTLAQLNDYISEKGLEEIPLPDFGYPAAPVFIGVTLKNLSTIYRRSDAVVNMKDGEFSGDIRVSLGLRDFQLHVQLCTFMRDSFTWVVDDAMVDIGLKVAFDGPRGCIATWELIKVVRLDGATVHTANAQWNNKALPDELIPDIISHYNEFFATKGILDTVGKHIELCRTGP